MSLREKIREIINGIKSQIIREDIPELTSSDATDIMMPDTSLVLIRKYESLSEKEQEKVDEFTSKIDISNFENMITFGKDQNKTSRELTDLMLKAFYDLQAFSMNNDASDVEKLKFRIEYSMLFEQLKEYRKQLEDINVEIELGIVALIKVFERERPRFSIKEILDEDERNYRRSINRSINEAINRMKICKSTVEEQLKTIQNWETVKKNLSDSIEAYRIVTKDPKIAEVEREYLEKKKEELLRRERLIFRENSTTFEEDDSEEKMIEKLAEIKARLDIFAYKNRDKLDKIRDRIKEICESAKKNALGDKLIADLELDVLKEALEVFGMYVKEEDWEAFYEAKFEVLVSDLNQIDDTPFSIDRLDEKEIEQYERILQKKIESVIIGRNPEFKRVFSENMVNAINQIKAILQVGRRFDAKAMLSDIMKLRLVLAFDREKGIDELSFPIKYIGVKQYTDFIEWGNNIPLQSIILMQNNEYYSFYQNSIEFKNDFEDSPFMKLIQLSNKSFIDENSVTREPTFREPTFIDENSVTREPTFIHKIPEGIVRIGSKDSSTVKNDKDNPNYGDFSELILPSTLKELGVNAIKGDITKLGYLWRIEYNKGLKKISEEAFTGTKYEERLNGILQDAMETIPEEVPEDRVERIRKVEYLSERMGQEAKLYNYNELEEEVRKLKFQVNDSTNRDELLKQIECLYKQIVRYRILSKYEKSISAAIFEIKSKLRELESKILLLKFKAGDKSVFANLDKDSEEYKYFMKFLKRKVDEIINDQNERIISAFGEENKEKAIEIIKSILGKTDALQDENALKLLFAFESGNDERILESANIQIPREEIFLFCDEGAKYYWAEKIPLSSIIKILNDPEYKNYLMDGRYHLDKNPYVKLSRLYQYKKREIDDKEPKTYRFLEGIVKISGPYFQNEGVAEIIKYGGYTRVVFPSTLKIIIGGGDYFFGITAFSRKENGIVKEIVLNDGLESIEHDAFINSDISEVHIPPTVRKIGWFAFKDSQLKQISIPESVKEIGDYAFQNTQLEDITVPASVEKMGNFLFKDCKKLRKAELNVRCMGNEIFLNCDELEEVVIKENVEEVRFHNLRCKKVRVYPQKISDGELSSFSFTHIDTLEIMGSVQEIFKESFDTAINQIVFRDYNGNLKGILSGPEKIAFCEGENDEPYLVICKSEWAEVIAEMIENKSLQDESSIAMRKLYEEGKGRNTQSELIPWLLNSLIRNPNHELVIKRIYEARMQEMAQTDPNIRRIFEEYKKRRDGIETECKESQTQKDSQDGWEL